MTRSPIRAACKTLLSLLACAAACAAALICREWYGGAANWWPPAVLVVGLGLAAGRGGWGGPVVAVAAGVLHAAAANGSIGFSVAGAAVAAWVLGAVPLAPARRWAAAGPAAWGLAEVLAGVGDWSARGLPAAIALGLLCGGCSAAVAPASDAGDRW